MSATYASTTSAVVVALAHSSAYGPHTVDVVAPKTELQVPLGQFVQDCTPVEDENVPAMHAKQDDSEDAPVAGDHVPMGQFVH